MQTLQTVLYGTKSSFVKATIYTRDLAVFKDLGFVESDHLLPDEKKTLSLKPKADSNDSQRTNK